MCQTYQKKKEGAGREEGWGKRERGEKYNEKTRPSKGELVSKCLNARWWCEFGYIQNLMQIRAYDKIREKTVK